MKSNFVAVFYICTQTFFELFVASWCIVTCSFTMDNIVESAKYNGDSLTIATHGNGLTDWTKEKKVTFESCNDGSPGKLTIKGSDGDGDGE